MYSREPCSFLNTKTTLPVGRLVEEETPEKKKKKAIKECSASQTLSQRSNERKKEI